MAGLAKTAKVFCKSRCVRARPLSRSSCTHTHTLLAPARRPAPPAPSRAPPPPAEDLDEESLNTVKQTVADVFENPPAHATYSEMARRIRTDLDKNMYGGSRGWSVVVGRSYGAYITQKIKNYAYLSVFPGACGAAAGGGGVGAMARDSLAFRRAACLNNSEGLPLSHSPPLPLAQHPLS